MRQPRVNGPLAGAVLIGFASAILASCASSDDNKAPTAAGSKSAGKSAGAAVSLKLLQFDPETVRVKVGTAVTWRNDESITHTVTSGTYAGTDGPSGLRTSEKPDGLFDSPMSKKGSTATYTFAKGGTFAYYCDIHKGMNGKVVVTP